MRAGDLPLGAGSSPRLHSLQNAALIILAFVFLPLDTLILFGSLLTHFVVRSSAERSRDAAIRSQSPSNPRRTVLVTGVGMSKGLAIARCFYAAGHNVIGADFEPAFAPITSGRSSRAIKTFYRLKRPLSGDHGKLYAESIIDIITKENVDIWVSCSGVASALEDGVAKELVEGLTPCRAIQFDYATTQRLHEKHSFLESAAELGLSVAETFHVSSTGEVLDLLDKHEGTQFILKYIGTDDTVRGDMTLLPFAAGYDATKAHVAKLKISPDRPFILQAYISGPEYCTHAVVVDGEVKVFTSCPSAELLMHYEALPVDSALNQSMLRWTQELAAAGGRGFTGHLSFDFLVDADEARAAGRDPSYNVKLYAIECNPRAHTAVVLFNGTPGVAEAYLSALKPKTMSRTPSGLLTNGTSHQPVSPISRAPYYWIGDDLVTKLLLPVWSLFLDDGPSFSETLDNIKTFSRHVFFWRDGTFEVWDPWPAWWLYHVYWPTQFTIALLGGQKWSRVNVSTCKMFMC